MKTQEEYALEIDEIVRRDVESRQSDWFNTDKKIFMQPENKNKAFILGTRKTGCDLIVLGGTNCDEGSMDWLFGSLGNENFYVCQPLSFYKSQREIQKVNPLYAFKVATAYFREQGKVPVFEDSNCRLIKHKIKDMERLNFETLFRIVRWDYNRCFKDESLDKDLFVEKYGRVMGEHYYNKFVHEFDGNILKMVGYFRGSEKEGQVFCDMITERIEKYEQRESYKGVLC